MGWVGYMDKRCPWEKRIIEALHGEPTLLSFSFALDGEPSVICKPFRLFIFGNKGMGNGAELHALPQAQLEHVTARTFIL